MASLLLLGSAAYPSEFSWHYQLSSLRRLPLQKALWRSSPNLFAKGCHTTTSLGFFLLSSWISGLALCWPFIWRRICFCFARIYKLDFPRRASVSFNAQASSSRSFCMALSARTPRIKEGLSAGLKWHSIFNKSFSLHLPLLRVFYGILVKKRTRMMNRDII